MHCRVYEFYNPLALSSVLAAIGRYNLGPSRLIKICRLRGACI